MARINKLYTFAALCAGMATGSTLVNKVSGSLEYASLITNSS